MCEQKLEIAPETAAIKVKQIAFIIEVFCHIPK
jgi:hypothetical protein